MAAFIAVFKGLSTIRNMDDWCLVDYAKKGGRYCSPMTLCCGGMGKTDISILFLSKVEFWLRSSIFFIRSFPSNFENGII